MMLIDSFQSEWQSDLNRFHATLPEGASLILLIDGVFVPGLFHKLSSEAGPILLFEFLPGCSKEARDVSPFVLRFNPGDESLARLLTRCSGWPMLSVIATDESPEQLAERLAAWCLVEVDGQNFNFRFPDTRRLPAIFETLTQKQRGELVGNAIAWHYIGRDGSWRNLPLEPSMLPQPVSDKAALDGYQFAQLLADSEPDEMWVQLLDRGAQTHLLPSQRYDLIANALHVANKDGIDSISKMDWCMDCINASRQSDRDGLRIRFELWKRENSGSDNENLCRTA